MWFSKFFNAPTRHRQEIMREVLVSEAVASEAGSYCKFLTRFLASARYSAKARDETRCPTAIASRTTAEGGGESSCWGIIFKKAFLISWKLRSLKHLHRCG